MRSRALLLRWTALRLLSRLFVLVQKGSWLRMILMARFVVVDAMARLLCSRFPIWFLDLYRLHLANLARLVVLTILWQVASGAMLVPWVIVLVPVCRCRLATSLVKLLWLIRSFRLVVSLSARLTGKLQALRKVKVLAFDTAAAFWDPAVVIVPLKIAALSCKARWKVLLLDMVTAAT